MSIERYAVIGDPVAHSLSPRMQMAAFRAAGIDADYRAVRVGPDELPAAVQRFRNEGFRGWNVTIPHKRTIIPLLDVTDESARQIGAVNTVVARDGALVGANTDVEGFAPALALLAGGPWQGPALVFGAGGAARAVVSALAATGSAISVWARRPEAVGELARAIDVGVRVVQDRNLERAVSGARLLVNATPLGMGELATGSPLPAGARPEPGTIVMDLVYGHLTPFLARCIEAGCRVQDGSEMLVRQGAASFRLWTGREPDIDAMRAACFAQRKEQPV